MPVEIVANFLLPARLLPPSAAPFEYDVILLGKQSVSRRSIGRKEVDQHKENIDLQPDEIDEKAATAFAHSISARARQKVANEGSRAIKGELRRGSDRIIRLRCGQDLSRVIRPPSLEERLNFALKYPLYACAHSPLKSTLTQAFAENGLKGRLPVERENIDEVLESVWQRDGAGAERLDRVRSLRRKFRKLRGSGSSIDSTMAVENIMTCSPQALPQKPVGKAHSGQSRKRGAMKKERNTDTSRHFGLLRAMRQFAEMNRCAGRLMATSLRHRELNRERVMQHKLNALQCKDTIDPRRVTLLQHVLSLMSKSCLENEKKFNREVRKTPKWFMPQIVGKFWKFLGKDGSFTFSQLALVAAFNEASLCGKNFNSVDFWDLVNQVFADSQHQQPPVQKLVLLFIGKLGLPVTEYLDYFEMKKVRPPDDLSDAISRYVRRRAGGVLRIPPPSANFGCKGGWNSQSLEGDAVVSDMAGSIFALTQQNKCRRV